MTISSLSFDQLLTGWQNLERSVSGRCFSRSQGTREYLALYQDSRSLSAHPRYGEMTAIAQRVHVILQSPSYQERLVASLRQAAPFGAGAAIAYGTYCLLGSTGLGALGAAALWHCSRVKMPVPSSAPVTQPASPAAPPSAAPPVATPTPPTPAPPPVVTPVQPPIVTPPVVTPTLPSFLGIVNGSGDNCWANALMQLIRIDASLRNYLMGSQCPASLRGIQQFLQAYDRDLREGRSICSASSSMIRTTLSSLVNGIRERGGHECAGEALTAIMSSIPGYSQLRITARRAYHLPGAPVPDPTRLETVCPEYALGRADSQPDWGNILLQLPSDEENQIPPEGPNQTRGALIRLRAQDLIQNFFFTRASTSEYATYPTNSGGRHNYQALGEFRYFNRAPEYLYITSNRFGFDGISMKKNSPIDFPLEPFDLPGSYFNAASPRPRYRLEAVVVHHGSTRGGHYISYAREGDRWFRLNDSSVQEVTDMRGPSSEGYIYLLRRC